MSAHGQYRHTIGFKGIADHQEFIGLYIEVTDQFLKIRFLFVTHDLDMMEIMFQS